MNPFLEGSLLYKFIVFLCRKINSIYSTSFIKRAAGFISICYSHSIVKRIISNYLRRRSHAEKSAFYKILRAAGKKLDALAGIVHNFFAAHLKTSLLNSLFYTIKAEFKTNSFKIATAVILPLILGFSAVTTLRGTWGSGKLIYVLFFVLAYLASLIALNRWGKWIKNSIIYKVCHYIWE